MTGVGLIGCGTIGTELATAVHTGKAGDASLVALYDPVNDRASSLARRLASPVATFNTFDLFLETPGMNMVVECASTDAVQAYANSILAHGKDLIIMSAGALIDANLFRRLADMAKTKGRQLMIPSGALGGIDAIRAMRDHLYEVTLTTTKSPQALRGAPGFKAWESKEVVKAQIIFEGPALEAITLFPTNVNVAATLSLAGLGPERTRVKIVADPRASNNRHEVVAKGSFGMIHVTMENHPHPENPRTSHLAILSAIEILRAACNTGPRIGT